MFVFQEDAKMFFYSQPTNLHKGFDRLTAFVQNELAIEFNCKTYFLFCNRKRDRIKVLYLDGNNLAIWCKRISGTLVFKYTDTTIVFEQKSFSEFLNKTCSKSYRGLSKIV
jgi:hypothetical protein